MPKKPKPDTEVSNLPEQTESDQEMIQVFGLVRLKDGYAITTGQLPVGSMEVVHRHLPLANVGPLVGHMVTKSARKVSDFYKRKVAS